MSAQVKAGIKEMLMAAGGAEFPAASGFTSNPPTIFGLGYRDKGSVEITHFNPDTDKDGREFPAMLNFKAEYGSKQMDPAAMKFFFQCALTSSIAAKVITGKPVKNENSIVSADGGIFSFDSSNSLGYSFELDLTPKSRIIKHTLERAFKYSNPLPGVFKDAVSATAPYAANVIPFFRKSAVPAGFINPSFCNIEDENLADFKINIKCEGTKNLFNKQENNSFVVELTASRSKPSAAELCEYLLHSFKGSISLRIPLGTTADTDDLLINFAADGLTQTGKGTIDDDKRQADLILKGKYDMDYASVDESGINLNTYL
jgi:hypothetical protein